MSDQCIHCTARGNLKTCFATDCSQHESWMVGEIRKVFDAPLAEWIISRQKIEINVWNGEESEAGVGILRHAGDRGILMELQERTAFYPWGAILSILGPEKQEGPERRFLDIKREK